MARRPKVFCWSDGLRTFTVAAPSRAKALEAWGVERDLFKLGGAREVSAGPDYEAALDQPGEVLERRLQLKVAQAVPRSRPKARAAPEATVRKARSAPSKADLARAARLEKALTALEAKQGREGEAAEACIARAEQALDDARDADRRLRREHREARAKLEAELAEARAAARAQARPRGP